MDIQVLGAWGEFLGGIAVILTLVYLAIQIRQNTTSVRVSSFQSVTSQIADLNLAVLEHEEVAAIVNSGDEKLDELSQSDGRRYACYQSAWFRHYENLHYQNTLGMLPDQHWRAFQRLLSNRMRRPGVASWWEQGNLAFSRDFREVVESAREAAALGEGNATWAGEQRNDR